MNYCYSLIIILIFFTVSSAQQIIVERIDPPNWWTAMRWNKVQLMIYGQNLVNLNAKFNNDYIKVSKIHTVENQKYAFIDVDIGQQLAAGDYTLTISRGNERVARSFSILERVISEDRHQGFSADDVIYLITPDRFVNGDTYNDIVDGMLDKLDRTDKLRRHGGDIQGIIAKLDYLKELGITAIWVNPLLENDMKKSYHGYAATDLYRIDQRFGSNELYKTLVREAHKKGLKIIMDHVSNHVGINHPWINDLPASDWLNASVKDHRQNRHIKEVLLDIHADRFFLRNLRNGWFVPSMPDLNQANPYLAKYLIQNTLWWIEFSGIDGIREDTYPYVDDKFMVDWARAVLTEYPNFNIVGEIWIHDPVFIAPYQKDNYMFNECNTYLPSITDFGIFEAFGRVFNRNQSIKEIYKFLSRDFLYSDPYNLVIFLDNHDVMRAMDLVHNYPQRLKMALQILLTIRGIPQIYYGTEIGMACGSKDHALIRQDFPGGFPDDERDAFTAAGRTALENEIFNHLQQLLKLRKKHPALSRGKFLHLPPDKEFYVYFRILDAEKIMMIVNNKEEQRSFSPALFQHHFHDVTSLKDLESQEVIPYSSELSLDIPGYDVGIYRLLIE